jgi:hypothetical protein
MIKVVNILSEGPISYNGRAFLQPIILNKIRLLDYSVKVNFIYALTSDITDCDLLIVDSKFFKGWWKARKQEILDNLAKFNEETNVIFFDTSDSAGYLLGEVLPFVRSYYKHQTLVDKSHYMRPMYGRRLFTDYYHHNNSITDKPNYEEDVIQVLHSSDLEKIKVSWNTGLANYSFMGDYLGKIYRAFPMKGILRYPNKFTRPSAARSLDVQCRFGTSYNKETVAFQRKAIATILQHRVQTKKVNRYHFYRELKSSKVVMSPFGLGEITLKDFEVFLSGSLLMKPDMSHMETWPNFYTKDTYVAFDWSLSDVSEKLEAILENYQDFVQIAQNGQDVYRHYIASDDGNRKFLERFRDIVFCDAK